MNPDQLADVLESGRYTKTTSMLGRRISEDEIAFCCLGVYTVEENIPHEWFQVPHSEVQDLTIPYEDPESNLKGPVPYRTALPVGYCPKWMLKEHGEEGETVMDQLITLNDTYIEGWKEVIDYLRSLLKT
jgi:hypothetical protein